MKYLFIWISICIATIQGCSQSQSITHNQIGGPCEDCQLMFEGMPSQLNHKSAVAEDNEPGERMMLKGVIYQADGKTPAEGIILYVYQTDNKGLYSRGVDQKYAIRHGHLRGWVKTNSKGEYEINTIRPVSYPQSKSPQHIHPIVYEPKKGYYWIDEFVFDDDPFLTSVERSRVSNRGGSGIITLSKNDQGVWIGQRDIVLGLNVSGYTNNN